MIPYLLYIMLWIWDNVSLTSASELSSARENAVAAYNEGKYGEAAEYYRQIVEGAVFSDPVSRMNMANAYYLAGRQEQARKSYQLLTRVADPRLASLAHARLAQLAIEEKDTVQALSRLRQAILLDRGNRQGVANFEVLYHRFSGKEPDDSPSENRQQETQKPVENGAPDPPHHEGLMAEMSDQKKQLLQNLERMNMTEEQAQSILDAMKTNEMQYIYQLRKVEAKNAGGEKGRRIQW